MRYKSGSSAAEELEAGQKTLCTTSINVLELFGGAYHSAHIEKNVQLLIALLEYFDELPFGEEVYHTFGYLSATLHAQGTAIGDFDTVIAAFALCSDREIVTRDRHFENISGLKVILY